MKKLYEVNKKYYCLAENEIEAEYMYIGGEGCTIEISEATSVDNDWWDALPFGDEEEERTCGEIIKALKEEVSLTSDTNEGRR